MSVMAGRLPHHALLALFDAEPGVRERAVDELPLGPLVSLFALREVLLSDQDASVRARVPPRLVEANDERVVPWLLDAVTDERPSVRDAAWNALARLEVRDVLPAAEVCVATDEVWWVRRAALRAAWRALGEAALPLLLKALEDPFWRVRHAATQALADLVGKSTRAREQVEALRTSGEETKRRAALWILSGEELLPEPVSPLVEGVDEDPAVTTARLERETLPVMTLVRLLGDPHEALRRVARRRLARNTSPAVARAVASWLDEPRVPWAAETARACLEEMCIERLEVAREVLTDGSSGPGQLAWACAAVAHLGDEVDLARVRELLRDERGAVRVAAAAALVSDEASAGQLAAALDDEGIRRVVEQAVLSGVMRLSPSATAGGVTAGGAASSCPHPDPLPRGRGEVLEALRRATTSRRVKVALAAELALMDELRGALHDVDGRLRASAVAALAHLQALTAQERARALADLDPLVRRAALDLSSAHDLARTDPDPLTRRLAIQLLTRERSTVPESVRRSLGATLAHDDDPELRASAAMLLQREDIAPCLSWLLRLSRDTKLSVRGAAASALETCPTLDDALELFLQRETEPTLRTSAFTWLLRAGDDAAFAKLVRALEHEHEPAVRSHLETLTLTFPDELVDSEPAVRLRVPTRTTTSAPPPREAPTPPAGRMLGRSGVSISPVILSGVNELNGGGWAEAVEAGVTSFFWEPGYRSLGRFLQLRAQQPLVVVTGTYHSGAQAIRRDVERHLKTLRRDALDVFLLFWARSAARLDDENFEALEALRAEGKVRTFGFSSHLRDVAADALERGWPVIMTRFSAAHPGAAERLLPTAARVGAGVLGFTSTCYGRLLQRVEGTPDDFALPTATECYRWSLDHPQVTGVVSGPRSWRELTENVALLRSTSLSESRRAALEAHGQRVRAISRRFNALVRQAARAPFPGA